MKKRTCNRRYAFVALLLCICTVCPLLSPSVHATDTGDGLIVASEPDKGDLYVTYQFTGEHAADAGYAEGRILIHPYIELSKKSYYHVCFANDEGVLADYKPLASVSASTGDVSIAVPRGVAIPEEATSIAVFIYPNANLKNPDISTATVLPLPQSKRFNSGKETLRFASLSDIHINYQYAEAKWNRTLKILKELGVDLIAISGDYTNDGSKAQFASFVRQIEDAEYEGTIWAALGNHDTGNIGNYLELLSPYGNDGQSLYFSRFAPNGDLFIFMAQDTLSNISNSHLEDCFSDAQMDWLEGLLRQYANTGINIFIFEHAAFLNWGPGDRIPGVYVQPLNIRPENKNIMRFKALLEEYKEVVMCSGHTHVAFSEMVNFSDNNGQSARLIHNSSNSQIRTYGSDGKLVYDTNQRDSEGYIVTVYEKSIVFRGMDFNTSKYIPTACYIMETAQADHSSRFEIDSISVDTEHSRTEYPVGDLPTCADITLNVTYTDGHTEQVTDGFVITIYGESYTVSPDQTKLRTTDTQLLISYGGKSTMTDIQVRADLDFLSLLSGKGTAEEPYRISCAADFMRLTRAWEKANDQQFASGLYFVQDADIALSSLAGYFGTKASVNRKYAFAGTYDGAGHTICIDVCTDSDVSVFPYINGTVKNVSITGTVCQDSANKTAQPVFAVGSEGKLDNFQSRLCIIGGKINAIAHTVGGSLDNVFVGGSVNGFSPVLITVLEDAKLNAVSHSVRDANGALIPSIEGVSAVETAPSDTTSPTETKDPADTNTAAPNTDNPSGNQDTPQTSDVTMIIVLVALVALGGTLVIAKRFRA